MSTIGLDSLYYATITEAAGTGAETYGTPVALSPAMKADLSVELAEAMLYADDAAAEVVKEFKSGKISLGVQELGTDKAAALLGAIVDSKGVLISAAEDVAPPVAIGFRARKSNGKYAYYWLYKVIFAVPSDSLQTKGDSISFATPTIEGTIMRRNKADTSNNHPWRAFVVDGEAGVDATTITGWFTTVYEPTYTAGG